MTRILHKKLKANGTTNSRPFNTFSSHIGSTTLFSLKIYDVIQYFHPICRIFYVETYRFDVFLLDDNFLDAILHDNVID